MSDSKESMEKVIGQLQNTVTELKGEECTLLGNLYKCQQSIPKENKQNLEIVARKIRAKCLSALSKTDVFKNGFHELYNENKKENNSPSVKSNEKNDDNDCGQLSDENDPLQKSTPDLFK